MANNPGIMTLRTGTARIITGYYKLIHVINLEDYKVNINKIRNNIQLITRHDDLTMIVGTINQKLRSLVNSFNVIYPHLRNRRGLINILGTGIKLITGNMDHEDAIEINNSLQELTINNKQLIKSQNEQVRINYEMIERFKNITNHINNQQEIIEKYLSKSQTRAMDAIKYLRYVYQINFDIDTLKSHLDDIFQTVQLAKLNVISKNILTPDEIGFIQHKLIEQSINFNSVEQIYEICGLQAYYNNTNILFAIRFPKLNPTIFNEYYLESLPNKYNKSMRIEYENIINNKYETYVIKNTDLEINNNKYYYHKNLINITGDECFSNILNNKLGSCKFETNRYRNVIKQILDNYIIVKNIPNTNLSDSCEPEKTFSISGTALIKLNNCNVKLNNILYENNNKLFKENHYIVPIHNLETIENINETGYNGELNLFNLEEQNIINTKNIEEIKLNNEVHNYTQNIILILMIIAVAGLIIILKLKNNYFLKKRIRFKRNLTEEEPVSSEPQSREGGVMYTHNGSSPNISFGNII